jgi:hypothetical protein
MLWPQSGTGITTNKRRRTISVTAASDAWGSSSIATFPEEREPVVTPEEHHQRNIKARGELVHDIYKKYGYGYATIKGEYGDPVATLVYTNEDDFGKEDNLGAFHANDTPAIFHVRLRTKGILRAGETTPDFYYSKMNGKRTFSFSDSFSKDGIDTVYLMQRGFFVRRTLFHRRVKFLTFSSLKTYIKGEEMKGE